MRTSYIFINGMILSLLLLLNGEALKAQTAADDPCTAPVLMLGDCVTGTFEGLTETTTPAGPTAGCLDGSANGGWIGGGACQDAWVAYVVPASGNINLEVSQTSADGSSDMTMAVYTGSCPSTFTQYQCSGDDVGLLPAINISDVALAGQTIYVRLWDFNCNQNTTDFEICSTFSYDVITDADTEVMVECGAEYNFFDSGGTGLYSAGENYMVTFTAPAGQAVKAHFDWYAGDDVQQIELVATNQGEVMDYLTVLDGGAGAPPMANYYGETDRYPQPGTIISTGNQLTFVFSSEADSPTEQGWHALIECCPLPQIFSETVTCGMPLTFSDDDYNANGTATTYGENEHWIVSVCPDDPTSCLTVDLGMLDLGTNMDYLYVYDGEYDMGTNAINGNIMGAFTGGRTGSTPTNSNTMSPITSTVENPVLGTNGGCLTFKFVTGSDDNFYDGVGGTPMWSPLAGFSASVTCNDDCREPNGNDACATATVVQQNEIHAGYNINMFGDADATEPPVYAGDFVGCVDASITVLENTFWYMFTVPMDVCPDVPAEVLITNVSCQNYNPGVGIQVALYETATCIAPGSPASVWEGVKQYCEDAVVTGETLSFPTLTPGSTYYIMIDGFTGQHCNWDIEFNLFTEEITDLTAMSPGQNICTGDEITLMATSTTDVEFVYSATQLGDPINEAYNLSGGAQSLGTSTDSDGTNATLATTALTSTGCGPTTYYIYSVLPQPLPGNTVSAICRPFAETIVTVYNDVPVTEPTACDFTVMVDAPCTEGSNAGEIIVEYSMDGGMTWTTTPPANPANGDMVMYQAYQVGADFNTANMPECATTGTLTAVCGAPNLTIVKANDPMGLVGIGDVITYTVTVTNDGTEAANNVIVTDSAPMFTTLVGGSLMSSLSAGGSGTNTETSPNVQVDGFNLGPNESVTMTFEVTVDAGTPDGTIIPNVASVVSDQTPPEDSNEVDNEVEADPELEIVKANNPTGSVVEGETITYTLTVTNVGSAAANNVDVTDVAPANTTYVPGSATVVSGPGSVTTEDPLLVEIPVFDYTAGNNEVVITFQVTVDEGTPSGTIILNTATVSSDDTPPEDSNEVDNDVICECDADGGKFDD